VWLFQPFHVSSNPSASPGPESVETLGMAATDDLNPDAGTRFNEGGPLPTLSAAPGGTAESLHSGVGILLTSKAETSWVRPGRRFRDSPPWKRANRGREGVGGRPASGHPSSAALVSSPGESPAWRRWRRRETPGISPVGRQVHITPALGPLDPRVPLLAEENGSCLGCHQDAPIDPTSVAKPCSPLITS
jgi:hypothetical protein